LQEVAPTGRALASWLKGANLIAGTLVGSGLLVAIEKGGLGDWISQRFAEPGDTEKDAVRQDHNMQIAHLVIGHLSFRHALAAWSDPYGRWSEEMDQDALQQWADGLGDSLTKPIEDIICLPLETHQGPHHPVHQGYLDIFHGLTEFLPEDQVQPFTELIEKLEQQAHGFLRAFQMCLFDEFPKYKGFVSIENHQTLLIGQQKLLQELEESHRDLSGLLRVVVTLLTRVEPKQLPRSNVSQKQIDSQNNPRISVEEEHPKELITKINRKLKAFIDKPTWKPFLGFVAKWLTTGEDVGVLRETPDEIVEDLISRALAKDVPGSCNAITHGIEDRFESTELEKPDQTTMRSVFDDAEQLLGWLCICAFRPSWELSSACDWKEHPDKTTSTLPVGLLSTMEIAFSWRKQRAAKFHTKETGGVFPDFAISGSFPESGPTADAFVRDLQEGMLKDWSPKDYADALIRHQYTKVTKRKVHGKLTRADILKLKERLKFRADKGTPYYLAIDTAKEDDPFNNPDVIQLLFDDLGNTLFILYFDSKLKDSEISQIVINPEGTLLGVIETFFDVRQEILSQY
jgi:hypothetical protein